MRAPPEVCAVVVAYHPAAEQFAAVLEALAPQVAVIVVVDNGGTARDLGELCAGRPAPSACVFLPQGKNVGIAAAQNAGIRWAVAAEADYVLLLDHDSVPATDMVAKLRLALDQAAGRGRKVAAAGPVFVDDRTQRPSYFVRFGPFGFTRRRCDDAGEAVIEADFLISSGTLVPTAALREVGLMDESLFIDHVDTEWCLRARYREYLLLGVCGARMSHRLGERTVIPGPVGVRPYYVHGPMRQYYAFRNSLLLYRLPHARLRWIFGDLLRLLALFVALVLFAAPRLNNIRAALRGLADGLRGRSGPAID